MAITEEVITVYKADIADFNAKFTEMENKHKAQEAAVSSLGKKTQDSISKTGTAAEGLGKKFDELGRRVAAAFTITAIITFGKASVAAFAEAELSVRKLNAALSANGGTEQQLKTLINQSKELQKVTIFSDEQIQSAQTLALQFGLTATEVERLIPVIADFASATGQDLKSALEAVLRGSEGIARGLKVYGIEIDSSKTKSERLAQITDQLTQKFSGQAAEVGTTTTGSFQKLKNAFDDLQESIGGLLAQGGGLIDFLGEVTAGLARFFKTDAQAAEEFNIGLTEDAKKAALKNLEELRAKLTASGRDGNDAFRILINESNTIIAENEKKLLTATDKAAKEKINQAIRLERARIDALQSVFADENKARVRAIKEGAEDAAKAAAEEREARIKEEKERQAAQEALKGFTLKTLEDNLSSEESQRKLAAAETIQGDQNLAKEILAIEIDTLEKRLALLIEFQQPTADIERQIADKKIEQIKRAAKFDNDQRDAQIKDYFDWLQEEEKLTEDAEDEKREQMQQTFDLAQELLQTFGEAFDSSDAAELDRIEDRKDARIEAIDEQIEALEDANSRGKLSDKKFEEQKKKLLLERTAAEKKATEEQNALKRKEAEREKLLSLFRIGLILAEAIAEQNVFKIIAAAAQLVVVAATPIPEFARGTKGKDKPGLGYVGERGKELMYIPGQAKIVPAHQTEKHKGLIDAMIDNDLEKYVFQHYVAPALMAAAKKTEKVQSKSFAENVAAAFKMKSTEWDTYHALQNNNKAAAQAIGEVIAKKINLGYKNPRYH